MLLCTKPCDCVAREGPLKCCHPLPFSVRAPVVCDDCPDAAGDVPRPELLASERATAPVPCPSTLDLPDCGGVKVRQPGRLDCTGAVALRPAPKADSPRPASFVPANDRAPAAPAVELPREAGEKKCCDVGGALRTADALAKRPDGV